MNLSEIIYKRKSTRSYKKELLDDKTLEEIKLYCENTKRLYPKIKLIFEFIDKKNVNSFLPLPWISNQIIAVFSEEKEGYLENVGFVLQQLDLYLNYKGIGSCYLGLGKIDSKVKSKIDENYKFVMMMTFGYPQKELYRNTNEFKRNKLDKISDVLDNKLEVARLAPSSVNSQPWYFVHEDKIIHVYCTKKGLFRKLLREMNVIDVGIALAHIYICNSDTFNYFKIDNPKDIENYRYIGSFSI